MPELKDILIAQREKYGSKSFVAKKLGFSPQLIGQYEKGRQKPKLEFFKKWKSVFGEDLMALTEETNVSNENDTTVSKTSDIKKKTEASMEDVLKHLIEGKADYVLINKELILEKYRLVSVEEIEEGKLEADRKHEALLKEIEERKNQIHGLYKIISDITSKLPEPVKPA